MNSNLLPNIYCGMFYWTGHFISCLFLKFESLAFMYPLYNWLMSKSCEISDKYNLEYWAKPVDHE